MTALREVLQTGGKLAEPDAAVRSWLLERVDGAVLAPTSDLFVELLYAHVVVEVDDLAANDQADPTERRYARELLRLINSPVVGEVDVARSEFVELVAALVASRDVPSMVPAVADRVAALGKRAVPRYAAEGLSQLPSLAAIAKAKR